MTKGLRTASAMLLLVIPLLTGAALFVHATLMQGTSTQRLLRVAQYERTRLGLLQIDGLPSASLDALVRVHERWVTSFAQPTLQARDRAQFSAPEYRGKALIDEFRRIEIVLRRAVQDRAALEDERLARTITWALAFSLVAASALLLGGLAFFAVQARSARRIFELRVLYENEKRIADVLQEAFLPKRLPSLPGIALHGTYMPASTQALVGGDWYDAFELPDKRILFSIGDVAGHGLEAAVAMSVARQAILAAALHEDDPGRVLERANVTLVGQAGPMVTAICGFVDASGFELRYATAGHPPPVLAEPGERAAFLPQRGYPLGVFGDAVYETFAARVRDGDLVVLYTDGVVEHSRDIIEGERQLLEASRGAATAADPSAAVYDAILGSVSSSDDVAILTISFQRRACEAALSGT